MCNWLEEREEVRKKQQTDLVLPLGGEESRINRWRRRRESERPIANMSPEIHGRGLCCDEGLCTYG